MATTIAIGNSPLAGLQVLTAATIPISFHSLSTANGPHGDLGAPVPGDAALGEPKLAEDQRMGRTMEAGIAMDHPSNHSHAMNIKSV